MSTKSEKEKKLPYGIIDHYSGKIGGLIFCKNGTVHIQKWIPKRKKKKL